MSIKPPASPMNREMVALGTGGWIPTSARQTSCYLYRVDKRVLILDAGSGFGRLTLDPSLLLDVSDVTVVLSHFHLDHIEGLGMINELGVPLTIGGPGQQLYDMPTRQLLGRFFDQPFKTSNPLRGATIVDLPLGEGELNDWQISCRAQLRHPLPSLGFRVSNEFAYLTDTEYDQDSIDFADGVNYLLHEAWGVQTAERGHTSGSDAARVARDAAVGRLFLTHLNPGLEALDILADARTVFPRSFLPEDGSSVFTSSSGPATNPRT